MENQTFSARDAYLDYYYYSNNTGTTNSTNGTWNPIVPKDFIFEVNSSLIKIGGPVKFGDKVNFDLSRFTLIERLKFFYNLLFKGKAVMEVNPKRIKLEKALEVLKNAK